MRQKLQLLQPHYAWELHNDLLGEFAELLGLPAPRVWRRIQQLRHRVLGLLPAAIYYPVLQLDNPGGQLGDWRGQWLKVVRRLVWVLVKVGGVLLIVALRSPLVSLHI